MAKAGVKPHPPVIVGGASRTRHGAVRYGNGWVPIAGRGNIEDTIPLYKEMLKESDAASRTRRLRCSGAARCRFDQRYRDMGVIRRFGCPPERRTRRCPPRPLAG
jgi:hypothetical protein